jgi:predicted aspartyl protease
LDPFQPAYRENHIFALRDAVQRASAPAFYKAAVEASANELRPAVEHLRAVVAAAPHSNDALQAHDILANLFFRNGRYRDGQKEIEALLKEHPDSEDARNMLPLASALGRMPAMQIASRKESKLQIEPGSTFLPLKLNGKEAQFFFDTGAGFSALTEAEVKELGLVAQKVNSTMADSSGKGVAGFRVVLVNDVTIGGLHLRNVPFLVFSGEGEPWNGLPLNRRGIIGLPILLAMRTLRWSPAGSFEFAFPVPSLNRAKSNMLFHNSNPVIDVLVEGKHLDFTLDTGAVDTDLNPPFAKALPELMKTGSPERRTIEGVGGTTEGDSILLPSVSFQIGARTVVLSPTHVFTEHGTGTWAAGNLGMDMLKQSSAFTLDFESMTLALE